MLALFTWDNSSIGQSILYQDAFSHCHSHCSYRKPLGTSNRILCYLGQSMENLTVNIKSLKEYLPLVKVARGGFEPPTQPLDRLLNPIKLPGLRTGATVLLYFIKLKPFRYFIVFQPFIKTPVYLLLR